MSAPVAARVRSWLLNGSAFLTVAAARVLLKTTKTQTALRVLAGSHPIRQDPRVTPQAAADAVAKAGGLLRAACLAQSVALAAVLQRTGSAPILVIGCRRYAAERWGAHAWVEVNGRRFDPLSLEQHEELCRVSAEGRWQIAAPDGDVRERY